MKKKLYLLLLLASILFALFPSNSAKASHAQGADISYKCLGNNQYQITYSFYKDCSSSTSQPSQPTIDFTSSCGDLTLTLSDDAPTAGVKVDGLCPSATSTCDVPAGTLPGVRKFTYSGVITLLPNCVYTYSYSVNARNPCTNILNAGSEDLYVEGTINTNPSLCNSSPIFTSLPVPYYCLNQKYNYSHGVVETDGDSLMYTLITPLGAGGTNIGYVAPYSATNPMPTASGFSFDQATGQMTFTPTSTGQYVVTMRVDEYRNGVKIGSTMRDIKMVILSCNNKPPVVQDSLSVSNVVSGVVFDKNSVGVCPGQHLTFSIIASDPNDSALIITSNVATSVPGATFTLDTLGGADSIRINFDWIPSVADSGFRYFTITVKNNTCPSPGLQLITYDLTVQPGTYAGPDLNYCVSGGPVEVNVRGGSHFSWTTAGGAPPVGMVAANADSSIVSFAPSSTTTYYIQSDLVGACKNKDTITINFVPSFNLGITAVDTNFCLTNSTQLTVNAGPNTYAPYTASWTPTPTLSSLTSTTPTATPDHFGKSTYTVLVTSSLGCKQTASIDLNVDGVAPIVMIKSDKNGVCPGDTVKLSPSFVLEGLLNCGLNPDGINLSCLNPGSAIGGTDQNPSTNTTPYQTDWRGGKVQYLFRASELKAAGMSSSTITDLSFFVTDNPTLSTIFPGFNVSLGCYADSVLPNKFVTGLTNVAVPSPNTIDSGVNTIILDNPYDWDGKSNLVVELCFTGYTGSTANSTEVITSNVFPNASLSDQTFSTTTSGCSLTFPFPSNERPNIKFGLCNPTNTYTYKWTPSAGLSCDTCLNPITAVNQDVVYTLSVIDTAGCGASGSIKLTVNPGVPVTAGNDLGLCDGKVGLNVVQLNPAPPACIPSYTVTSVPYAAIAPTGAVNIINGTDDSTTKAIPLPFDFDFFCQTQNTVYINSNGFITFSPTNYTLSQSRNPLSMPNSTVPNNMIALCWDDLDPSSFGGGTIDYFVKGTAPNRVFVVRFNQVQFFFAFAGEAVNGEIQLFEGTNIVEIHADQVDDNGTDHVLGIEDATGTKFAVAPGKNNSPWLITSGSAWRFTPDKSGLAITNYAWSPASGLSDSTVSNPVANPTTTTTYNVTVTYDNGCKATDDVKVTLSTFPYTLLPQSTTVCPGDTAQLNFNGPGVKYEWTPGTLLTDSTIANPKAVITQDQQFKVTATNADNCIKYDSLIITVHPVQPVSLGDDQDVCACKLTLTPSLAGTHYEWSNKDTTESIVITTSSNYSVTVTDANGCKATDEVKVDLRCLSVNANAAETNIFSGDSTQIFVDNISYQGNFQYRWLPDTLVLDSTLQRTATTNLTSSTTYTVIVTDLEFGCKATDTITVNVKEAGNFVLPNAFSPNGDGKNDHFYPVFLKNTGAVVVEFKIYDRWGQLVHNNPAAPGWDGSFKGTAQSAEQYTFFLTVDAPDAKDPSKTVRTEKSGTFALIR